MSAIKIIVIEDEVEILEEILDFLSLSRFEGMGATNGRKGLELIREQQPDLIICDINMPDMDGYAVLDQIRSRSDMATIPFIFLTAKASMEDLREGMSLGASDYITKPFKFPQLLSAIETRLSLKEQREANYYRAFAQRLVEIHDHERARIAKQLSENLLMDLTSTKMTISLNQETSAKEWNQTAGEVTTMVQLAIDQVNELSNSLYPELVSRLTVPYLIKWLMKQAQSTAMFDILSDIGPMDIIATEHLKRSLFYILNELLQNTAVHAQATLVHISVKQEADELWVMYEDDGIGFDWTQYRTKGNGLVLLEARVQALAGQIQIDSAKQKGMRVVFQLPLSEAPSQQGIQALTKSAVTPEKITNPATDPLAPADNATNIHLIFANDMLAVGLRHVLQQKSHTFNFTHELQPPQFVETPQLNQSNLAIVDSTLLSPAYLKRLKAIYTPEEIQSITILAHPYTTSYIAYLVEQGFQIILGHEATPERYLEAVQAAGSKEKYLSGSLKWSDIEAYQAADFDHLEFRNALLTKREQEILELMLGGLRSKDIADNLFISTRTVEAHRKNIMQKFGAQNSIHLTRLALERGYKAKSS